MPVSHISNSSFFTPHSSVQTRHSTIITPLSLTFKHFFPHFPYTLLTPYFALHTLLLEQSTPFPLTLLNPLATVHTPHSSQGLRVSGLVWGSLSGHLLLVRRIQEAQGRRVQAITCHSKIEEGTRATNKQPRREHSSSPRENIFNNSEYGRSLNLSRCVYSRKKYISSRICFHHFLSSWLTNLAHTNQNIPLNLYGAEIWCILPEHWSQCAKI